MKFRLSGKELDLMLALGMVASGKIEDGPSIEGINTLWRWDLGTNEVYVEVEVIETCSEKN